MDIDRLPLTIPELLRLRAEASPQGTACCVRSAGAWQRGDWGTLWADVCRLAAGFRQRGLGRGDRLAVIGPPGRGWLVAEMGGLLAGGVIVGIDPHASDDQASFVLKQSGAVGLVAHDQASLDRLPRLDGGRLHFMIRMANIERLPAAEPPSLDPPLSADDAATIIFTAGTTGTSKGIEYTHGQVMIACRALVEAFPELSEGDATLCWLPMAHLYQRMMNLLALADGMVTYFVEDPREVVACLSEVEPALLAAVPRFYEKLHDGIRDRTPQAGPDDLRRRLVGRRMKVVLTGSAPIAPRLLEFFHSLGLLIYEGYALSENTVPMTANLRGAWRFGSVGKPFPHNEIRLADDGEILVRGPGVFRGYYRDAGPSDRFTADGFYRTGDIGRFDEDGFLYLTGRKAEIIKTSTGRRIAPAQVEATYKQVPYLDQVVVFGDGRKYLVALVTLNPEIVAAAVAVAGLPVPATSELAALPFVKELVGREMEVRGTALAAHERVHAFAMLPAPLSAATRELTPTMKLRRAVIAAHHADLIEGLYREDTSNAAVAAGEAGR